MKKSEDGLKTADEGVMLQNNSYYQSMWLTSVGFIVTGYCHIFKTK